MNTKVNIAGIELKNPVMTASGTFGSGMEYSELTDIGRLGAIVTKGVAITHWEGNPTPRVTETSGGMLNAIGLQNPGVDVFMERDLPFLKKYDIPVIVNVCGHTVEEYCAVAEKLNDTYVSMYEINVSCPNVKQGALAFGQDAKVLEETTKAIKAVSKKPVIMKLSPNVTSIKDMALAAQQGGADAVSLINTLIGMKIDIERKSFVLANKTGGYSGPAVKPVALRMVYEVAHAVDIPVIGMGGISSAEDAIEFIMAGATGIAVGTANFVDPQATAGVIDGIEAYMKRKGIEELAEIRKIL
ncbi:MAG: dihydroorotate dehydrogenase [Lachnospiraceae bacterium]|nr:dihydroorotate dehydrogenase [Lachnospiraceae bacterium]